MADQVSVTALWLRNAHSLETEHFRELSPLVESIMVSRA